MIFEGVLIIMKSTQDVQTKTFNHTLTFVYNKEIIIYLMNKNPYYIYK